jgi:protein-S-isoprenylcysteine O-methyltransferase Ste14
MDFLTILRILWDRFAAWVTVLAGLIAVILGIVGVRDNAYVAAQMPYVISGGVLGLFLLGLGATLWLSADLRDQWRVLLEIRDQRDAPAEGSGEPTISNAR